MPDEPVEKIEPDPVASEAAQPDLRGWIRGELGGVVAAQDELKSELEALEGRTLSLYTNQLAVTLVAVVLLFAFKKLAKQQELLTQAIQHGHSAQ